MIDNALVSKIARLLLDVAKEDEQIFNGLKKIIEKQSELESRIKLLEDKQKNV